MRGASLALLLVACGPEAPPPEVQAPPPPPPSLVSPPVAVDAPAEVPTPSPAPLLATTGEPHTVAPEPRMPGMRDGFTFWGWSADGRRYAFQTYNPGEGGTDCDMVHDVYVVDARTDAYVPEGHLQVGYDWPEGGPDGCMPRDLPGREQAERTAFLETHSIEVGRVVAAQPFVTTEGKGIRAGGLEFQFQVLHGTDDAYGDAAQRGAAYALSVITPTGPLVLESGERRRKYVLDYRPVLLFRNPEGTLAAVVVQREHSAFEGTRWSWMSNGLALP